MDVTVSGFKVRGDWEDVVKHGERVTRALRESGVLNGVAPDDVDGQEAFEEWDDWRPKSHEGLDAEMNEKTAEQAAVDETGDEDEGRTRVEDLPESEDLVREAENGDDDEGGPDVVDAIARGIDEMASAAGSASRAAVRRAEQAVYKNLMTQVGPQYFDNHLVSANIQRTDDGEVEIFVFEIDINDDDLKDEVQDLLEAYDDAEEATISPDVAPEEDPADPDAPEADEATDPD